MKTNKTGSFFPRESGSGSTSKLVLCSHSLVDGGSEKKFFVVSFRCSAACPLPFQQPVLSSLRILNKKFPRDTTTTVLWEDPFRAHNLNQLQKSKGVFSASQRTCFPEGLILSHLSFSSLLDAWPHAHSFICQCRESSRYS